ncbi:3-oxoacid CoA-transferase subunit A [Sutcliffiella rhizosphaerae]|uniref:Butyrate--acetoacetate CoA-transferase subunit A n=1 Tax=Sutcliffiella rhizosphaerae TaxID=2880967 RepID=A0ABN8AD97_9BACI|nr:CoA transferase subunit A [Sutcliffiella rhizosphaerae]CAG9621966.1 Butyrate--acetoacetate CoA-transferase subunit A [Sutcliffiella rhizosphaerae]
MEKVDNRFQKIVEVETLHQFFYDNMTIMFGGFGGVGTPPRLVDLVLETGVKDLTLIGNDAGFPTIGIGKVVCAGRVQRLIASHIGSNPEAGKLMTENNLQVEFSPQGTLAERIRAGGVGLGGILVDVGITNEIVTKNKSLVKINGDNFIIEMALTADVSVVYAKQADPYGNLVFDKSARNTNPLVAMAGKTTIVEVEEFVPLGHLDPEAIVTPGVYIDFMIQSKGVNWKWVWEKTYGT